MEYEIIFRMFEDEKPESIFEVGVSGGMLFKEYAGTHDIKVVGGMDINPNSQFPVNFPDSEFKVHDATKVPWPIESNSYDIVFTVGTLLCLPNPYPVIKEMLRICKDKIIIAENQNDSESDYGTAHSSSKNEYYILDDIIDQPVDPYEWRVSRDYKKVFEKLGKQYEIVEGCGGKTIFKCKK